MKNLFAMLVAFGVACSMIVVPTVASAGDTGSETGATHTKKPSKKPAKKPTKKPKAEAEKAPASESAPTTGM